ncbi:hypothetical protein BDD12DRAFT_829106 [Trichophaea hybrida]|nr:hypothetical protein BDD12DRAFT_829106 [Trichophaea hybrida]
MSPFIASGAISQQASIRLVTTEEENDSLIMPTIPSVVITRKSDHDINKPTPYTAPTRLDTPPLQTSKKYRKTPPPEGFFRAKVRREKYSAAPSLYTLTDESEGEVFPRSEPSSTVRTSYSTSAGSSDSYYINSSSGSIPRSGRITISSRTGGIVISTGVPAASIVTPVPVNAVTTVAIRALVARVSEFGGLKL